VAEVSGLTFNRDFFAGYSPERANPGDPTHRLANIVKVTAGGSAVHETLAALRERHPSGKLCAVFEARSATACRRMHQAAYARAFDAADEVLLAPLGRSNLPPEEALDLDLLVTDLLAQGKAARRFASVEAILDYLALQVAPGSVVALLSNGAFGGIHSKLLGRLDG